MLLRMGRARQLFFEVREVAVTRIQRGHHFANKRDFQQQPGFADDTKTAAQPERPATCRISKRL